MPLLSSLLLNHHMSSLLLVYLLSCLLPISIPSFPHLSAMQPFNQYFVSSPPNSSSSVQPSYSSDAQPTPGSSHLQHLPGPSSLQPPLIGTFHAIWPTCSIMFPPTLVTIERYGLGHPSPLEWLNALQTPWKVESLKSKISGRLVAQVVHP